MQYIIKQTRATTNKKTGLPAVSISYYAGRIKFGPFEARQMVMSKEEATRFDDKEEARRFKRKGEKIIQYIQ